MKCDHPPSQITEDVLQGEWSNGEVRWCRLCGALYIRDNQRNYSSPWMLPRGQMQAKDVRCQVCWNYVPGHATGAADICTCEPIAMSTPCSHEIVLYNEEADNFYCKDCKQGMGEEYYHLHKTWQNEPQ